MNDECRNHCIGPEPFPRPLHNRRGLSRISYRIGDYADIREVLLRRLDREGPLLGWTHREADDPGIALLEGAAILGDILTFYQELYANEAYARTARWRESLSDLVRLVGYRPAPGIGGRGTFAFEVKGEAPVDIPRGFPLTAHLEGADKPADFQTTGALTAHPHLSRFHFYRPRVQPGAELNKGDRRLQIDSLLSAEGSPLYDIESKKALGLAAGDRLILVPSGDILIIKEVRQLFDRTLIELEGALTRDYGLGVSAYPIGRSFRHFGHNAPAKYTYLEDGDEPKSKQRPTGFTRWLDGPHTAYETTYEREEMPLDVRVDDLAPGGLLICERRFEEAQEKTIEGLRTDSLSWGNLTAPCTVLTLDRSLMTRPHDQADIRHLSFHEVTGPKLTLTAPLDPEAHLGDSGLFFWGTYPEAQSLLGRPLALHKPGELPVATVVTTTVTGLEEALADRRDAIHPWMWPIALDQTLEGFVAEDFDEERPLVDVFGNLAEADQGRAEREAVLGDGDAREAFQTFKLPDAPLTYLRSDLDTPPFAPELEVLVDGRRWQREASLFGRGPGDEVYIVREDSAGDSWIQFGDGRTGARLPTGRGNGLARYRIGTGAHGNLQAGGSVRAGSSLERLKQVQLPGAVTGGEEPEPVSGIRGAAPASTRGLDRLVGLDDYQAEAMALPGVAKAQARWALYMEIPSLVVTLLMDRGRGEELQAARRALIAADRARGLGRAPIQVEAGIRQYLYLALSVCPDPARRKEEIKRAVRDALGVSGGGEAQDGQDAGADPGGLFAPDRRGFGEQEYVNRIEGLVQNVDGVLHARVDFLDYLAGEGPAPDALTPPSPARRLTQVLCPEALAEESDSVLLCLHERHFQLLWSSTAATQVPSHD